MKRPKMAARPRPGDGVGRAKALLRQALAADGVASAALDARLLLCAATRLSHEDLVKAPERPLSPDEAALLEDYLNRRRQGEPVARILGSKEFWGRTFVIAPQTLVPRPDSETLVETALRLLRTGTLPGSRPIADLGTGSGCLLVSILADTPGLEGIGTDSSYDALVVAAGNAHIHAVASRSLFVLADFAAALPDDLPLIVANPPYIASDDIRSLVPDVRCYEPRQALDGGTDGLRAIAALARQAVERLAIGGRILLEIGQNQERDAACILIGCGLDIDPDTGFVCDISGKVRVLSATRRAL